MELHEDIPDFLLVANRVPLTDEQRARLAAIKVEHPSTEDKWARNRRLYDQEGDRLKALAAEKARPAKLAFYAKMKAEADEIKAVKQAAKAAHKEAK
jgi:L-aminopeptidase/D-esterase-like protein